MASNLDHAHFAVQGLRLLFLALEADDILSGKANADEGNWLRNLERLKGICISSLVRLKDS